MTEFSATEKLRRESLTLRDRTWKVYDKYYSQLEKYLDDTGNAVSETSLLAWVLHLKTSGAAVSTINKTFACHRAGMQARRTAERREVHQDTHQALAQQIGTEESAPFKAPKRLTK